MRLFIFILVLSSSLLATEFSTRYDVDVGMFGKVGYADVVLNEDSKHYEIKLVAKTTGTAAKLTSQRRETYISKGDIIAGKYIPQTFTRIKTTAHGERKQTYHFDHKNQQIRLDQDKTKRVKESNFDAIAFKIVKEERVEHSNEQSILPYYNENDVLSSYLNTKQSCNARHKEYSLLAVGAHNDKKDITLSFLDGLKREKVASSFSKNTGDIYNLQVKPIGKEDEAIDVLIAFDNDGHMKEAVLGDVFWIGEIKATRVYHNVASK